MPITSEGTAYDLTGNKNGIPVVLIHGLGLCRHLWKDHLPALETHCHILNFDLYGHGDSSPPKQTASLPVYAQQIAYVMNHVGFDQAAIVGFSIGGMINRRFAMDYSDRVSALVILNSPHDRGDEAQNLVEERASKVREQGPMATLGDALKRWFTQSYLETAQGVDDVRSWRKKVDPESYAQAAWVLASGVRELINPIVKIEKPTFVLTCENDSGSTPKMSHDIASEISNSQTQIIPELKHLGLMEKPAVFYEPILEFLERELA